MVKAEIVDGELTMKGNRDVINQLNQVLYHQLTAINQYFLHSRMFNDWGIEKLGSAEYKESIRQMKDADKIIERILFLEGLPNLQNLGKLYIGQHTLEVLNCDVRKVNENIEALQKAVSLAEQEMDYVTRDLVQEILKKEEEYLDWTTTQLDLVEKVGIENYIQSQI
jgi:bacterioferritin